MKARRAVRLRVPRLPEPNESDRPGARYRFGSGYLIGPGRVLTTRHVVQDQSVCCDVLPAGLGEGRWLAADAIRHDEVLDLAVVSVPGLEPDDGPTGIRLGELPEDGKLLTWRAIGYRRACLDRAVRHYEDAYGTLPPTGVDRTRAKLKVASPRPVSTEDGSGWVGLSGAALFVEEEGGVDPQSLCGSAACSGLFIEVAGSITCPSKGVVRRRGRT